MPQVLDANGLIAFLEKEPGFETVRGLLVAALETDTNLLMTSVNFGEVYYITLREGGQDIAHEIERIIQTLPIEIVDVDTDLAKEASRFKARGRISYADCFAAALAKIHDGEVITGDKEFKAVEGEVKIAWIV